MYTRKYFARERSINYIYCIINNCDKKQLLLEVVDTIFVSKKIQNKTIKKIELC